MNITNQLRQVSILLAHDGFIPILKQMTMPPMTPVEFHGIPCQQFPHARRQRPPLGLTEDMKMVGQKGPRINIHRVLFHQFLQSIDKIEPILIIEKDLPFLDAPPHHMVQNPWSI
jgi:hypothetical protein